MKEIRTEMALELQASPRQVMGKKTRFLRRQGLVPAHIFGHDIESRAIEIDTLALKKVLRSAGTSRLIELRIKGGSPSNVLVREVQREPRTGDLLHVDFYQVKMGEKIRAEVPLYLVGEPKAAKKEGLLVQGLHSIEVECTPDCIPPNIQVDVSGLAEIDQAIYVKDLALAKEITIITDAEQTVARIQPIVVEKVVAPVAAEAAAAPAEGAEGAEGAAAEEAKAEEGAAAEAKGAKPAKGKEKEE